MCKKILFEFELNYTLTMNNLSFIILVLIFGISLAAEETYGNFDSKYFYVIYEY